MLSYDHKGTYVSPQDSRSIFVLISLHKEHRNPVGHQMHHFSSSRKGRKKISSTRRIIQRLNYRPSEVCIVS